MTNYIEFDLGTFTAIGNGDAKDLMNAYIYYTWQQSNNATESAPEIALQGSVDGNSWYDIDVSSVIGGEMRHIINRPIRRLRASVKSMGDATSIDVKCIGAVIQ